MSGYIFKTADSTSELQAVHSLNYRTFVEEIPQHPPNSKRMLIDRFDRENTYIIASKGQTLVGMVAVRGQRPFSLDEKLEGLDDFLPSHKKLCEIRLLSVEKAHRNGFVFKGLMNEVLRHADEQSYDLAVISGTVHQLKLYRHMGFVPFCRLVGKEEALFQPMYLSRQTFYNRLRDMASDVKQAAGSSPLNFLPGPVRIKENVKRAFSATPISHRSELFKGHLSSIKSRLSELTGAKYSEVMLGSGTLANDAIAWQLKQLNSPGLVLTSGEFGDRLIDHARRASLDIQVVEMQADDLEKRDSFNRILQRYPETDWLWTVHCETSTGVMIDLPMVSSLCSKKGVKLCIDAISTFGLMPLDLRGVYFASVVSGKAVGGYPGLSSVFYSHALEVSHHGIPRYLDLSAYAENNGVPYTHSSNLVDALDEALKSYPAAMDFAELEKRSAWLRNELTGMGCEIISPVENNSPAVVTISLPETINSRSFGDKLADNGFLLSYQSGYLLSRNRIQICMMGDIKQRYLQRLLGHMRTHMDVTQ
jgi:aspartate aminotransferase-like enzyme